MSEYERPSTTLYSCVSHGVTGPGNSYLEALITRVEKKKKKKKCKRRMRAVHDGCEFPIVDRERSSLTIQ